MKGADRIGERIAIVVVIVVVVALFLSVSLLGGKEVGMGQPQPELAVGEYQLFYLGPNPFDDGTMVALVRGETEIWEPLYVTLSKSRFEGSYDLTANDPTAILEVTKVVDLNGKRTVYRIIMR